MKFRNKKERMLTIGAVIIMLLLSLIATSSVIVMPPLITGLSRWGLLVFPFFQQRNNTCSCK